ncbi:hypothetical protein PybrP1_010737, partial [[Pythium] brassicae (nom. inval.)]
MAETQEKPPLKIGVIVFEGVMMLDYIGPTSYLECLPSIGIPIEILAISQKKGSLRSTNGVPLDASVGYADAPEKLDILLIPGGLGRKELMKDTQFLAYIGKAAQQATFVLTVCTGSWILGHTGFLDGRRATTNKLAYDEIVPSLPNVSWVRQARWVVDGNVWTSSGVAAGMDMAYAFIASLHGSAVADNMANCVFLSRRIPHVIDQLKRLAPPLDLQISLHTSESEPIAREELLRGVEGCAGLLCLLTDRVDAELLDRAGPSLKVVSTMSVGFNHIDVDACRARNVRVGHTPGVLDDTTAETAVALTFAAKRRLLECADSARNGAWGVWQPFGYCGTDVSECTVGVVGLGRIGATYARMMKFGFNCKILYTGPREKPEAASALGGDVEFVDMDTLLARSDVVSVHVPLTDATRLAFGAACFAKMQPGAVFVNTSRGEVVDQDALCAALRSGQIAAAGLDVTTPEPLPPSHELFALANCVVLPHIGSATVKTRRAMADIAVRNLLAGVQDHELVH